MLKKKLIPYVAERCCSSKSARCVMGTVFTMVIIVHTELFSVCCDSLHGLKNSKNTENVMICFSIYFHIILTDTLPVPLFYFLFDDCSAYQL